MNRQIISMWLHHKSQKQEMFNFWTLLTDALDTDPHTSDSFSDIKQTRGKCIYCHHKSYDLNVLQL